MHWKNQTGYNNDMLGLKYRFVIFKKAVVDTRRTYNNFLIADISLNSISLHDSITAVFRKQKLNTSLNMHGFKK